MAMVNRTQIINNTLTGFKHRRYLEIGVQDGINFIQIKADYKVGVDPIDPKSRVVEVVKKERESVEYFPFTSDEFFDKLRAVSMLFNAKLNFDVVFIDGLHEYEQAYRDIENALEFLDDNGVIILHDCKPTSVYCALPTSELLEAAIKNAPEMSGEWTGDVYRAILRLRSFREDLNVFVLDCDYGVGIVTKEPAESMLNLSLAEIAAFGYDELSLDFTRYLNLKPPTYYDEYFKSKQEKTDLIKLGIKMTKLELLKKKSSEYSNK